MRHRKAVVPVLLLAALAALPACRQVGRIAELNARSRIALADPFTSDIVAKTALEVERRSGLPLRLLAIEASNAGLSFQVQDPHKPENVDEYSLDRRGALVGPKPVQLIGDSGIDALETRIFALSEIDLTRIPEFGKTAVTALGLEGAKPLSVTIRMWEARQMMTMEEQIARFKSAAAPPPRYLSVRLYVDSPRRRAFVEGDAKFAVLRTSVL